MQRHPLRTNRKETSKNTGQVSTILTSSNQDGYLAYHRSSINYPFPQASRCPPQRNCRPSQHINITLIGALILLYQQFIY